MTCACAVTCPQGLAISADSSLWLSFAEADGKLSTPLPYSDTQGKLGILRDRFIVALGGTYGQTTPAIVMAELEAAQDPVAGGGDAAVQFLTTLARRLSPYPGAQVLVGWIDDDGKARVALVIPARDGAQPRIELQRTVCSTTGAAMEHSIIPFGHVDVITRLVADASIAYTALSLEDAANLSRFMVQTTADLYSFELRERTVSGFVWTAVATREGARIVRRPPDVQVRDFGLEVMVAGVPVLSVQQGEVQ